MRADWQPSADRGTLSPMCSIPGWLEESLAEERAALQVYLEDRHFSFLRRLDQALAGADASGQSQQWPRPPVRMHVLERIAAPPAEPTNQTCESMEVRPSLRARIQLQEANGKPTSKERPVSVGDKMARSLPRISNGILVDESPPNDNIPTLPVSMQDPSEKGLESSGGSFGSLQKKAGKKNVLRRSSRRARPQSIKELVEHPAFESFFICLICLSSLMVACELQYWSYDAGLLVGHPSASLPGKEAWPWAEEFFQTASPIFGFMFVAELLLKIYGLRLKFFKSVLNLFDLLVVVLWLADYLNLADAIADPTIIRLIRLARVMRLTRVVRFMRGLDQLFLIVASLEGSMSILFWATLILTAVMILCALFFTFSVRDYIEDESASDEGRRDVYNFFGSFTRAMLTMFELTLGNWMPPTRSLMENISEWFAAVCIIYKCVIGFALVKVITGVFMCETFKVAATNDEIMIMQRTRAKKRHLQKMKTLFSAADNEGDGNIGLDEFTDIMREPRVVTWLSAMELDPHDANDLFHLLDDGGDGNVSLEELAAGITKLKGASRSLDVHLLMRDHRSMSARLEHCAKATDLHELRRAVFTLQASLCHGEQKDFGRQSGQPPPSMQHGRPGPRPEQRVAPVSPHARMQQDRQRQNRERHFDMHGCAGPS